MSCHYDVKLYEVAILHLGRLVLHRAAHTFCQSCVDSVA